MPETMTIYVEVPVEVSVDYFPGYKSSVGKYGLKDEPDEPASVDIVSIGMPSKDDIEQAVADSVSQSDLVEMYEELFLNI